MTEPRQQAVIAVLLITQLAILALSMIAVPEIGIFCTAPRDPALDHVGRVHMLYAGLLLAGFISLIWKPMRLPYAVAILLSLIALPLQYWWVQEGRLYCDAP